MKKGTVLYNTDVKGERKKNAWEGSRQVGDEEFGILWRVFLFEDLIV